ncbi:yippee putative zinc-binding protein, partial [Cooperia oncophora]
PAGGLRVVVCRFCKTYLTNRSELISSRFQGSSGRAMLFHRAWNLDYSEAQHRDMMTGKHIVRDVMCRICHKKVGWMYEFAMEESQRYKEARVILEKALIDEEDGFPDPAGALETHEQPPPFFINRCLVSSSSTGADEGHSHVKSAELIYRIDRKSYLLDLVVEECLAWLSILLLTVCYLGSTGRAFLFRRVANTRQGSPVVRKLTTGNHMVRDVFCLCCGTKLGWLYEFTCEVAERYKEGKFILERRLVRETEVAHNQLAEREWRYCTRAIAGTDPTAKTSDLYSVTRGSGQSGSYVRRRCGNRRRDAHNEYSRRGSVSPGANSGDEYDVGFRDDALEADFARLLKRTRGFEIKVVRGDGSCMFRAVADQLYADQDMHGEVRRLCMDYMERNRDHFAPFVAENFSSYVARKRQPGAHGNHVELQAISEMFARPIEIYEYSENPRNVFYPTIRSLDVNVPIRLSYHGSSHYNSVVDPFAPTAGIGLGLPDLYPRGANNLRDAVKESEDRSVEQAILESQLALTDIERTEREINEQIARDSYMEYLSMLMDSRDVTESHIRDNVLNATKESQEAQGSAERPLSKSTLYEELLALEEYGPCPATAEEEDEALACALSLSKQQYLEELQYRYGSGSDEHNIN